MPTNTYNFNHRKGAFPQLKRLFSVEADYQAVKDAITRLVREGLDLRKTPSARKDALKKIAKELLKHPAFQKNAKRRVYFALQASMELDRRRRREYKSGKLKYCFLDNDTYEPSEPDSNASTRRLDAAHAVVVDFPIGGEPSSTFRTLSADSNDTTDFLITFLSSCQPPLIQYLTNFEIFGTDEASLRGIAQDRTWTREKKRGMMRDILATTGEVSEMHVRILENQLENFSLTD